MLCFWGPICGLCDSNEPKIGNTNRGNFKKKKTRQVVPNPWLPGFRDLEQNSKQLHAPIGATNASACFGGTICGLRDNYQWTAATLSLGVSKKVPKESQNSLPDFATHIRPTTNSASLVGPVTCCKSICGVQDSYQPNSVNTNGKVPENCANQFRIPCCQIYSCDPRETSNSFHTPCMSCNFCQRRSIDFVRNFRQLPLKRRSHWTEQLQKNCARRFQILSYRCFATHSGLPTFSKRLTAPATATGPSSGTISRIKVV